MKRNKKQINMKKKKMNKQQWMGLFRHTLTFVGGILITQGVIDEGMYTELSGAAMTLIGSIWSIIEKQSAE